MGAHQLWCPSTCWCAHVSHRTHLSNFFHVDLHTCQVLEMHFARLRCCFSLKMNPQQTEKQSTDVHGQIFYSHPDVVVHNDNHTWGLVMCRLQRTLFLVQSFGPVQSQSVSGFFQKGRFGKNHEVASKQISCRYKSLMIWGQCNADYCF